MKRLNFALLPIGLSLLTSSASPLSSALADPPAREREEKKQAEEKRQADDKRQRIAEDAARRDRERQAEEQRQKSSVSVPPPTREHTPEKPVPPVQKPAPPVRQSVPPTESKPTPPVPDARRREEQRQAEPSRPPVKRPRLYYVTQPTGVFAVTDDFQRYPVFLSNRVADDRPVFCPETSRVAFVAVEGNRRTIHTVDADGNDERRVTDPSWGDAYQPTWSPDGRYVAFVSDRDGEDAIYVTDTTRNTTRNLTDGFGRCVQPVWHPSGKYLIFLSDHDGLPGLYKMSPWSGAPTPLMGIPAGPISDPVISPDGKTLAFTIHRWQDRSDLYTFDLGWLSGMRRVAALKQRIVRPAFSPDSFRLYFEARGELWSVKRLGNDLHSHGAVDAP